MVRTDSHRGHNPIAAPSLQQAFLTTTTTTTTMMKAISTPPQHSPTRDREEEVGNNLGEHPTKPNIDQVGCTITTTDTKNMKTTMTMMMKVIMKITTQCVDDGQDIRHFF
jgi:hypothetical protein